MYVLKIIDPYTKFSVTERHRTSGRWRPVCLHKGCKMYVTMETKTSVSISYVPFFCSFSFNGVLVSLGVEFTTNSEPSIADKSDIPVNDTMNTTK